MSKFCVLVENSVGAILKLGFSDRFFIKIVSLVGDAEMEKLTEEFEGIPIVGRGCVSDEFSNLDMDTKEGALTLQASFNAKYGQIKTIVEECD